MAVEVKTAAVTVDTDTAIVTVMVMAVSANTARVFLVIK